MKSLQVDLEERLNEVVEGLGDLESVSRETFDLLIQTCRLLIRYSEALEGDLGTLMGEVEKILGEEVNDG